MKTNTIIVDNRFANSRTTSYPTIFEVLVKGLNRLFEFRM